jgi:translation initiation factor 2 gamma subunit (eIF-2gamma)
MRRLEQHCTGMGRNWDTIVEGWERIGTTSYRVGQKFEQHCPGGWVGIGTTLYRVWQEFEQHCPGGWVGIGTTLYRVGQEF